jgi:hypothetical protein
MPSPQQIEDLRRELVRIAKSPEPKIPYSEIDHIVGLNVVAKPKDRITLGRVLSCIGVEEIRHDRPYLPAVVVRKSGIRRGRPGGRRFYEEVRRLCPQLESITDDVALHDAVLTEVTKYPWK